jgi:xanthine dehydrogenase accessory factor
VTTTSFGDDWVRALRACIDAKIPCVLVTVAATKGSVPREPGARLVVTADTLHGTIGGGHLEFKAAEIARRVLAGDDVQALQRFPLGASLGQCCGGVAELLFEPVLQAADWLDDLRRLDDASPETPRVVVTRVRSAARAGKLIVEGATTVGSLGAPALDAAACAAARELLRTHGGTRLQTLRVDGAEETLLFDPVYPCDWRIVLFGAGHVGQALVRTLADMPCRITWVDTRDQQFPREIPGNVAVVATDTPEAEVDAAPVGAHFLVMTHSHGLDQALTERILRRADFAWFGLIGSATKRRQFEHRLRARGISTEQLGAMTCPIGVEGIEDKRPAAIAIAVAAQVLQVHQARAAAAPYTNRTAGRTAAG